MSGSHLQHQTKPFKKALRPLIESAKIKLVIQSLSD
jgi:hypothetical protein